MNKILRRKHEGDTSDGSLFLWEFAAYPIYRDGTRLMKRCDVAVFQIYLNLWKLKLRFTTNYTYNEKPSRTN